tara:strand:+ start:2830 stop:3015 length:186 start_codon:yes stop_codon:yes gene_type:complete
MIEFLKDYQVAEHKDGLWSVIKVKNIKILGAQLSGRFSMVSHGFNTAAEAQELADDLNKGN